MPTTENSVAIFSYIGQDVRTVRVDGEPWFVAADVCRVLEHTNPTMAVAALDDDERGLRNVETPSGDQSMVVVSEAGLYALIIRSRKSEAKQFKRWITHVVLPEIRQTGSYVTPAQVEPPEQLIARALVEAAGMLAQKDERIAELEPRADAWNAIASAEGDYSVGDAAKMLARAGVPTGPQRLFNSLVSIKWAYRGSDGKLRAYSDRVEKGYLSEKPQFHYHPATGERVLDAPQVRVTMKGIDRLRQRLHVGALKAVSA